MQSGNAFLPSRLWIVACLTVALIGGILGYWKGRDNLVFHQVFTKIESSIPSEAQLFYDVGKGFNERDSDKRIIYKADEAVVLDFELTGDTIRGLRFDPSRSQARIKIHEIILKYHDEPPFIVPLDSLKAARDVRRLHFDGDRLIVETTAPAEDPILYLTNIGPVPRTAISNIVFNVGIGSLIALGVAFFTCWVYRSSRQIHGGRRQSASPRRRYT